MTDHDTQQPAGQADARLEPIHLDTPGGQLVVRLATAADEPALRRLFKSITMEADLALRVEREPDFFTLYRMQDPAWEAWVGELDGELVGLGTLMARDGYLGGERTRVGYLGDLRLDPRIRGREVLATIYGQVLDGFADRHGVDVFLTVVIASNRRAIRALTGPGAAKLGIPTYHLLQQFDIRAVQAVAGRRPSRAARLAWRPRAATAQDADAIAELLDRDARSRAFGIPMDTTTLRTGLERWPGLSIEDFQLLERRANGELVGCIAAWDATPAKQTIVTAYRGSMRWIRRGHDAAALLARRPRLPAPGKPLRYAYATHHAVLVDDPLAHRTLVHAAWAELRARRDGHVFLSCRAPRADAARSSYSGFVTTDLPAHAYAVVPHGRPLPAALQGVDRVGFEMAFA